MVPAPIPSNEKERMSALVKLGILDTKPEARFDSLTKEASEFFNVPISIISIIDKNREWYKSCQGLNILESDRSSSFCGHAMLASNVFIVEDTLKDNRFKDNPQVINFPNIRFYAGVALRDQATNLPIGAFCIKDTKPRKLSLIEVNKLLDLAQRAEQEINNK